MQATSLTPWRRALPGPPSSPMSSERATGSKSCATPAPVSEAKPVCSPLALWTALRVVGGCVDQPPSPPCNGMNPPQVSPTDRS